MSGYSLHVKSHNKHCANILATPHGEVLVATRGATYCLIADNKTEHCSWVTVTIDRHCIGRWKLPPRHKLTLEKSKSEEHSTETSFVFGTDIESGPLVCQMYTITAEFEPAGVIVQIPVHVCEHEVNIKH